MSHLDPTTYLCPFCKQLIDSVRVAEFYYAGESGYWCEDCEQSVDD